MGPTANLEEQLRISRKIVRKADEDRSDRPDFHYDAEDIIRLAELVIALDEWKRSGGFDPEQWKA